MCTHQGQPGGVGTYCSSCKTSMSHCVQGPQGRHACLNPNLVEMKILTRINKLPKDAYRQCYTQYQVQIILHCVWCRLYVRYLEFYSQHNSTHIRWAQEGPCFTNYTLNYLYSYMEVKHLIDWIVWLAISTESAPWGNMQWCRLWACLIQCLCLQCHCHTVHTNSIYHASKIYSSSNLSTQQPQNGGILYF